MREGGGRKTKGEEIYEKTERETETGCKRKEGVKVGRSILHRNVLKVTKETNKILMTILDSFAIKVHKNLLLATTLKRGRERDD